MRACVGSEATLALLSVHLLLLRVTDLLFFSSKVRLNRTWAEEVLPLGPLDEYDWSGILINLEIFRSVQMTTKEDGSSFNFGLCLLTCGAGLERAKKELAATSIVSGLSVLNMGSWE